MKIGSLCTGYGGLDMAVESYFDAEMVWCAEVDKYASALIEQRFNKPNLGDIKQIDWANVEPIDILTAGYPCQPFSHAGQRKGENDKRHIWPFILEAISILRPKFVVLENVRGHLSLGLAEVLKGLSAKGYDAKWDIVRASDVGAPHQRARLFIIAYPNCDARQKSRRTIGDIQEKSSGFQRRQNIGQARCKHRCSCEDVSNTNDQHKSHNWSVPKLGGRFVSRCKMYLQTPPDALDQDGKLNAKFVEYMMGLPTGWVTDLQLSRAQQLKMLGNGVVPQQAYYALQLLCDTSHISYIETI
jgi:DNA (cytosine-5)-methyltransferase 1